LTKREITTIFQRTQRLYPEFLIDCNIGEPYTVDHPAAEGIATILKIKLDETDAILRTIEDTKRQFLARELRQTPEAPTIGDYMKIKTQKQKHK
jgi:hypothetical protein